jgi:HEAT repeat protein
MMFVRRRCLVLSSRWFLVLCVIPGCSTFGKTPDLDSTLQGMIAKIEAEHDDDLREQQAESMSRFVASIRKTEFQNVSDLSIDSIAKLLQDPDDLVRVWAAESLGHFEVRAKRALPALRHALNDAKIRPLPIILPSKNSITSIEIAISVIDR